MIVQFFKLLSMEIKKAVRNKFFCISLAAGMFFSLLSAIYSIENYMTLREELGQIQGNPMLQAFGLYNMWIGGECNSVGFVLFYSLLPILATLPYGWGHSMDRKVGYDKMLMIRTGRLPYFLSKYTAAFVSGGLAIVLPLLMNFIGTACFIPAVKPSILYDIYYPIHCGSLWSELFFSKPLLFVLCYLILDFLFAGLFACVGITISFFSEKLLTSVLMPYLLVLVLHYARTLMYGRVYKEISPLNFLHALCIENIVDGKIVFAEGAVIFIAIMVCLWWKGKKYEAI